MTRDTIFALATAPGRAAIAVVRMSGPEAGVILKRLCPIPAPRQAALRVIRGLDGQPLDEALVLWFPGPNSFTGEDVFELQLHGGPAIVGAVAETLTTLGGRLAEPGEFTRRAFEAGRLELSQAEAIGDLVDAETEAQRKQALAQLGGNLARQGEAWRETLLSALAFLEAQIDFPDEEIPTDIAEAAREPLLELAAELDAAIADVRGERIRDGLRIALIGAPNAGKSSLLNALVRRDAAIVTAIPGATRDVIEIPMLIDGYKVLLADMAGIRAATDEVEIEGVRRAKAWAASADLRLWIVDTGQGTDTDADIAALIQPDDLRVLTKADLGRRNDPRPEEVKKAVRTSTVEPDGVEALRAALRAWVSQAFTGTDTPTVTQLRHRILLIEARDHLARGLLRPAHDAELIAEDVRLVAHALERLSGRLDPDAVLDRVFSSFCIGK